jgi:hypothetical protein
MKTNLRRPSATAVGIQIITSTDRTAWTYAGLVWPSGASWTDTYTGTSNGFVVYQSTHDFTVLIFL